MAHSKGVYRWDDPRCTAELLGFKNDKQTVINKILNTNRNNQSKDDELIKKQIKKIRDAHKNDTVYFYLDFETINVEETYIFMIGIGYESNELNKFVPKCFVLNNLDREDEKYMFTHILFPYIMSVLQQENKSKIVLYHWSPAEPTIFNKFISRNNILNYPSIEFHDLYKTFTTTPIIINGALNYSLKTVARALHQKNMIQTIWDSDSVCSNGLNAMILAYKLYKNKKDDENIIDNKIMKEIIYYNEVDYKTMWEIVNIQ